MSTAVLMEREFEDNICAALADRGWLYDPADTGWDHELALHGPDALAWLAQRNPDEYAKAVPDNGSQVERGLAEQLLLSHLSTRVLGAKVRVDAKNGRVRGGLLGALREGFKYTRAGHMTATFGAMAAFPPANPILTSAVEATKANRLRVIRQVRFDSTTNETIDLVLCVNGVPVVTMELKTDNTQAIDEAKKQYRQDRKPGKNRPLLAAGRCLVHFAVSNSEVYMTTELEGDRTFFLPFNKGTEDGHPGNPPSKTGSATDYLWREVFDRHLFLRLLTDYALWEPAKRDKKGKAIGSEGKLIFPRYHQLRATEAVSADIDARGPGGKYLIWHSAGSGKTKTITWMSHNLIRKHDAAGNKVFDSVILITDRTVLDQNIRDDIALLQASDGLIVAVGETGGAKSPQLLKALTEGGHIISCTLQTFPEVVKLLEDRSELEGRNWCVIADEAHSSQTGSAALSLRRLLADADPEDVATGTVSTDDLLARESAASKALNLTYVALTATPKAKTLRLFGSKHGDGEDVSYLAFDTYTMAQAIGEGFILDVLGNYTTYDMFARVRDKLGREEHVNRGEAVSDLVRFVRLHPTAIAQKVEVVVEHFRRNVAHHLGGHARAMVVTSSRQAAVKWSLAMNEYIAKKGYSDQMRTLVAFSGTVELDGDTDKTPFTEAGMNQRGDTESAFKGEDGYRVLIVADKFQTGFDEPRLCAMYVDKKLSGITTVQTLSRLNRMCPGKPKPLVLDFINSPENVQADFKVYYSDAQVVGEVDPNSLHDLADALDTAGFYTEEQMNAVADAYARGDSGEDIRKLITPIIHAWNGEYRQAKVNGDKERAEEILDFRSNLTSYKNAWEFLTQIVDYADAEISKRAAFAMILARNLKITDRPEAEDYVGGVELAGVGVVPDRVEDDLSLTEGTDDPLTIPGFAPKAGSLPAPVQETFERVIEEVNERFAAAGITAGDQEKRGFLTAMWGVLGSDSDVADLASQNTGEQMAKSDKFKGKVTTALFEHMTSTEEMGTAALANPEILDAIVGGLAEVAAAAKQFGVLEIDEDDELTDHFPAPFTMIFRSDEQTEDT